jgi:threonine dehydrogenase-like Zn-dependent dehydrogenase
MKALTVQPGRAGSLRLDDLPEPVTIEPAVLVEAVALGVCGTDIEIIGGEYGVAPPDSQRLVLGHESLGQVLDAPAGTGLETGQLVVAIVRRPDPEPCPSCAHGEWDMCSNGLYTEGGIWGRDGYGRERYPVEPEFTVPIDNDLGLLGVLLEPTTVVAKVWEQVERIGSRAYFEPRRALITGAGPIGLLASLLASQRGLEVHVLDQVSEGLKPDLVHDLGGIYHTDIEEAAQKSDVVIESTGTADVVLGIREHISPNAIVCLTGVPTSGKDIEVDFSRTARSMVLRNEVVFGSVNANRRHYEAGADALAAADRSWLERLITRRVPVERWQEAFERRRDDVKTVIDFENGGGGG